VLAIASQHLHFPKTKLGINPSNGDHWNGHGKVASFNLDRKMRAFCHE
jgi:hypothetical protein